MKDTPEIAAARIEAGRARARFLESLRAFEARILELKQQLTPSHIIGDAWDAAKSKGADLAEDAVDAVKSRPYVSGGVIAAITMFLAREPLMDLANNLVSKKKSGKTRSKSKSKDKTEAVND